MTKRDEILRRSIASVIQQARDRGIEIIPDDTEHDVLMCMPAVEGHVLAVPSVYGDCDDCGERIYWSQRAPKVKRRVCTRCGLVYCYGRDPTRFVTTPSIEAEITEYLARKK
jgi:hypothetical protein